MEKILSLKNPPAVWVTIWGDGSVARRYHSEIAPGVDENHVAGVGCFGGFQMVTNGEYSGKQLEWLYKNHPEYFGTPDELRWEIIPVAAAISHAADDLSIQVHPREDWAMENIGMHGKSECWYFVDCLPNANVVMGHNAKTMEELENYIEKREWEGLIKRYPIHPGGFYAIKAGTLHAIQKGTTFIEICNPSPITYRFYDYDRLDQDGKLRSLDLEKAKQNILIPFEEIKYEKIVTTYSGVKETFLADNEDYSAWLYEVDGEGIVQRKKPFGGCFVIDGEGKVDNMELKAGQSFLITRAADSFKLEGKMNIICCHG